VLFRSCPYNLFCEQLSGSAFTKSRHENLRSWQYRIRPSVIHEPYVKIEKGLLKGDFSDSAVDPNQMRWSPLPFPEVPTDFVEGLTTYAGIGDPMLKCGFAIHYYVANKSMDNKCFSSSDGDFLIVAQAGALFIRSEFGNLEVRPREIGVIPRGVKFSVDVSGPVRGYISEIFEGHFKLPDLGPIGANGLANPRDFLAPVAAFVDIEGPHVVVNKFGGELFSANLQHCPYDVVAWHGNYYPYKYNLDLFCTMNSVCFDHPDPSIYTVLTCPSAEPGTAVCDFVIFPPRWMVMEHSFRPPYFHRNTMTEFMGLIDGEYDAKAGGFVSGGASLHSCMSAHGPDAATFDKASNATLTPHYFCGGLAFMFETKYILRVTPNAQRSEQRQQDYFRCWQGMPKPFTPDCADPYTSVLSDVNSAKIPAPLSARK